MKNTEFVKRALDIAKNYKTVYMWGTFGAPVKESVIAGKTKQYPDYYPASKQKELRALIGKGYFAFDCVGLIKSILWGWAGNASKSYGGAKYASNGVPDTNAGGMFNRCKNKSADFSKIKVGSALRCPGHIGIYVGDGLAVEATPKWGNGVQITAVGNIGKKDGYPTRMWDKHGELPYITYVTKVKISAAKSKDKTAAKGVSFIVVPEKINVRAAGKSTGAVISSLKKGEKVTWYGYYTGDYLYVKLPDKSTGYVYKGDLKQA